MRRSQHKLDLDVRLPTASTLGDGGVKARVGIAGMIDQGCSGEETSRVRFGGGWIQVVERMRIARHPVYFFAPGTN